MYAYPWRREAAGRPRRPSRTDPSRFLVKDEEDRMYGRMKAFQLGSMEDGCRGEGRGACYIGVFPSWQQHCF